MSLRSFFFVVISAAVLAACSSTSGPVEAKLQVSDFSFEPKTIEVQAGQQLTISMENTGAIEHDFVIMEVPMEAMDVHEEEEEEGHSMEEMGLEKEPALHMAAHAGESDSLTFVPTQPGTYEFFCSIPGHKEAGMVGSLIVR